MPDITQKRSKITIQQRYQHSPDTMQHCMVTENNVAVVTDQYTINGEEMGILCTAGLTQHGWPEIVMGYAGAMGVRYGLYVVKQLILSCLHSDPQAMEIQDVVSKNNNLYYPVTFEKIINPSLLSALYDELETPPVEVMNIVPDLYNETGLITFSKRCLSKVKHIMKQYSPDPGQPANFEQYVLYFINNFNEHLQYRLLSGLSDSCYTDAGLRVTDISDDEYGEDFVIRSIGMKSLAMTADVAINVRNTRELLFAAHCLTFIIFGTLLGLHVNFDKDERVFLTNNRGFRFRPGSEQVLELLGGYDKLFYIDSFSVNVPDVLH